MQAALLRDRDREAGTAGPGDRALRGVFIIAQTPFRQDLQLDEDSLRREMDFLVRCRVHGVVWPVAASEAMRLSFRERTAGAEWIAQELRGRLPFVVGVTATNRFEAAEYAAQARELGVAGAMVLRAGPRPAGSGPFAAPTSNAWAHSLPLVAPNVPPNDPTRLRADADNRKPFRRPSKGCSTRAAGATLGVEVNAFRSRKGTRGGSP